MKTALKFGATAVLGTAQAFAHTEAATKSGWSFDPGVVIPLVIALVLFAMGTVRRRDRPDWSRAQFALFISGWLTLFFALVSPVHKLGTRLFSVHMTQHELLMIVAAPLLVLSRPILWFLWALPQSWREAAGQWTKRSDVAALWAVLTAPLFVWLLHGSTLWAWHI